MWASLQVLWGFCLDLSLCRVKTSALKRCKYNMIIILVFWSYSRHLTIPNPSLGWTCRRHFLKAYLLKLKHGSRKYSRLNLRAYLLILKRGCRKSSRHVLRAYLLKLKHGIRKYSRLDLRTHLLILKHGNRKISTNIVGAYLFTHNAKGRIFTLHTSQIMSLKSTFGSKRINFVCHEVLLHTTIKRLSAIVIFILRRPICYAIYLCRTLLLSPQNTERWCSHTAWVIACRREMGVYHQAQINTNSWFKSVLQTALHDCYVKQRGKMYSTIARLSLAHSMNVVKHQYKLTHGLSFIHRLEILADIKGYLVKVTFCKKRPNTYLLRQPIDYG